MNKQTQSDTLNQETYPMLQDKYILGRKTKIDLLDFAMHGIDAKVDTGAYKNALHCSNVRVIKKGEERILAFHILDESHPRYEHREIRVKDFSKTRVVNSFGQSQRRYVIKSKIMVQGHDEVIEAEFTLADRSTMRAPILLGRKFLRHKFIVDVAS